MHDAPRQALLQLIRTHGPALADDERRLEGLLRDYAGTYRREITVLVAAAREGIPRELLLAPQQAGGPVELRLPRLVQRLEDNRAISHAAARWAVEAWAEALDVSGPGPGPRHQDQSVATSPDQPPDTTRRESVGAEVDWPGVTGPAITLPPRPWWRRPAIVVRVGIALGGTVLLAGLILVAVSPPGDNRPSVSPTRPIATPRSAAAVWQTLLTVVDEGWGVDWPVTISQIDGFRTEFPGFPPSDTKLYEALVARSDQLTESGRPTDAVAQLLQAQQLLPNRSEAPARLRALTPTATPSPTATLPPTPTPRPAPGQVVLADDFSNPTDARMPVRPLQAGYTLDYEAGEYRISITDPNWSSIAIVEAPGTFENASLAVDARLAGPFAGRYLALGCRMQPGLASRYQLVVDPEVGAFWLSRWDNTVEVLLAQPQASPMIRRATQVNRLELSCVQDMISVRINGTAVATVRDATYGAGSLWLGGSMFAGTPPGTTDLRFDNLVVTQG